MQGDQDGALIVTGAGGGVGRRYAKLLTPEGALAVVNDLGGALDGSSSSLSIVDSVVRDINRQWRYRGREIRGCLPRPRPSSDPRSRRCAESSATQDPPRWRASMNGEMAFETPLSITEVGEREITDMSVTVPRKTTEMTAKFDSENDEMTGRK